MGENLAVDILIGVITIIGLTVIFLINDRNKKVKGK